MFLLRFIDLLALIGLFVQAFVAWVFVAVLASIGRRETSGASFRTFLNAFVALALALSVMSARFFRAHDVSDSHEIWTDGDLRPTLCYAAYMGLKVWFGLMLVQGSHQLGTGERPRWLLRLRWPVVAAALATPFALPGINDLLVLQAPFITFCALAALRALRRVQAWGSGPQIVKWSLIGLAASWSLHACVILVERNWHLPVLQHMLALNSFIDLAVQLTLGVGLIVWLLQDAHGRLLSAEQERERLRRVIDEDDKLRALGTVVSGVAHELNNPLTVILGYSDLLQQSRPGERSAAIIAEQAQRCRGIVRNLSALAGQSIHTPEDIDVEDLARRVVRGLSPESLLEGRRVEIEPMRGVRLCADRIGIEQVLANLVLNGLYASPPGGAVTIRAAHTVPGGPEVEICVRDQGPGVSRELRDRLFEPFFTTKAPGKGTGLGLSIAHAIVRGHGGSIRVENPPGGGALFRVLLPGTDAPAGAATAPIVSTAIVPPRLLIVDDDPGVRAIVREQGERRGWEVREAGSADQALASPLDGLGAILCDLRMPGIGGAGFHDRLRAERPDLLERVLFITGDLGSEESVRFSERCTRPLLQKPVDFEELFRQLADAASISPAG